MMLKNSSIKDFFNSFAQPQPNKRSSSNDSLDQSRLSQRLRSNTPDPVDVIKPPTGAIDAPPTSADQGAVGKRNSSTERLPSAQNVFSDEVFARSGSKSPKEDMLTLESRTPVLTSSQRVVKNGEVMIQNSDDESNSEMSLDDIDDLIVAQKIAVTSAFPAEPELPYEPSEERAKKNGKNITRDKTNRIARTTAAHRSSNATALPNYKFSLNSLAQRTKDDEAAEAGTAKARSLFDSLESKTMRGSEQGLSKCTIKVDADLVASVMKGKGEKEDTRRLMTAIQRTEAFHYGKTWSFFDDMKDSALSVLAPFPSTQDWRWYGILGDPVPRQQAFLGGFVGDIASKKPLPEELLLWMLDAVCLETRDDLRSSYIYTIEKSHGQITHLLTPSRIDMLFRRLGASIEALNINKPILPKPSLSHSSLKSDWTSLAAVISLLSCISGHLSDITQKYTTCMLCRLLLDSSAVRSCDISISIGTALVSLIDCIEDQGDGQKIQEILNIVYLMVNDSVLRLQLLENIPASSPRSNLFRRRLALAFFFEDDIYFSKDSEQLLDLRAVVRHLQKPCFAIRNDTDYPELTALISILSIGVDNGDPPPADSDAEKTVVFNEDVDLLSSRINGMFTSIVDTGASHMRRTEAKEVLEGFHYRLLYAVRTKRKPKTMLFDGSAGTDWRQKTLKEFVIESDSGAPAQNI